jgi:hypothetical protein
VVVVDPAGAVVGGVVVVVVADAAVAAVAPTPATARAPAAQAIRERTRLTGRKGTGRTLPGGGVNLPRRHQVRLCVVQGAMFVRASDSVGYDRGRAR